MKPDKKLPERKDIKEEMPLSKAIKNAHASGDGALERNDEHAAKPEKAKPPSKENPY